MGCQASTEMMVGGAPRSKDSALPYTNKPIPTLRDDEYKEIAWGVNSTTSKVEPMHINRHKVGDFDVKIDMLYCGVCHTDMHFAHNDMGGSMYPMVPGHELVGKVVEVGPKVTKVKIGDNVGVGCMVDSCLECDCCKKGDEQYCKESAIWTYNGSKKQGWHIGGNPDTQTFGGYTASYVCFEHFVCKIPDDLTLEKAGPLMCAGITMFEPLKNHGALSGKKMTIGIVGIGGLGTMGIKLAKAMGHRVVAISRTKDKEALAKQKGAESLVASTDEQSMASAAGTIDLILNTISTNHQAGVYLPLLANGGTIVQLGVATEPHQISQLPLMFNRVNVTGSAIGGIRNTQEMLEFCAWHKVVPDTQEIKATQLNWAWAQLVQNKDAVRYVINIKESLKDKSFLPK